MSESLAERGVGRWMAYVVGNAESAHDPDTLRAMLHEDCVFHSPVVHTPQRGQDKVFAYLFAADKVLAGDGFSYVRTIVAGDSAMLEFQTEIDGILIDGVDIITWGPDGRIVDFKVMVRPLKAINKVWEKMGEMLAKANA